MEKSLYPPMALRFLACLLLLTMTPATWAGVVCMAKDHTVIEAADAACCVSAAGRGTTQMESGGCGPCVDIEMGVTATLKHERLQDASAPQYFPAATAFAAALATPGFLPDFVRTASFAAGNFRAAPPLLSPLRC